MFGVHSIGTNVFLLTTLLLQCFEFKKYKHELFSRVETQRLLYHNFLHNGPRDFTINSNRSLSATLFSYGFISGFFHKMVADNKRNLVMGSVLDNWWQIKKFFSRDSFPLYIHR